MTRPCSVCTHAQRREIDNALLEGTPYRVIARRYGMHYMSAERHARHHLSQRLEQVKMWELAQLAQKLQELDGYAQRVLTRSEAAGDDKLVLAGVETAGRNVERLFKLTTATALEARIAQMEAAVASARTDPSTDIGTDPGAGEQRDGDPEGA